MATIYCVEDDQSIRELVIYALKTAGFEAEGFVQGSELFAGLETHLPDLIILDIMLPELDGLSILERLRSRQQTATVPVLLLTAKSSEYDKVKGLDLGADDYMVKPFGIMELISRIKALLRRSGPPQTDTASAALTCGSIALSAAAHTVHIDGVICQLTFKEFALLEYLLQNQNLVLTREKLMANIWGFDFEGESRTVDMHIKTLRQKLGTAGGFIKTVRGVGYKMEE